MAGAIFLLAAAIAGWKMSAQRRAYWKLYDTNRIAEETAVAIASMRIEECAYLQGWMLHAG